MNRHAERGTTLLELLISVTLLSLLTLGVLYSMRVGVNAMDKTNDRFSKNRRVIGADRALTGQIGNLMPVPVECGGQKAIMFQGDPQAMRFVSTYSLNEGLRGYPKLLEYMVIPHPEGRGVRLIVSEVPYSGPFSLRGGCVGIQSDPETGQPAPVFVPVQPRPDSFILADQLSAVRFIYKETMPPPILERWRPKWSGNKLPAAIRVEIVPLEPAAANLQTLTTTVPVRITGSPLVNWVDVE